MAQVGKGPAPGTGATVGYSAPAAQRYTPLEELPEDQVIELKLNGSDVKARKGETIMEVCHRQGTYVPHYCWHPSLSIAGNCRLCLVEVEKVPKPVIACQTPVSPGMVVWTTSETAKRCQADMMEFLLVNHPLDCPICDRGGECQLQRYSMEYGHGHARMADKKRKFIKPQADPLIDIERNRCIMCTRCVRFCDEVGGAHVMGVFDRGAGNYIGTFGQGPISNIFSGNVIDLCPVGCLTSKPFRFRARPWELTQTQSTCDLCSSGCKVTTWTRNGRLYRTTPPSRHRHDRFTINEDTEEFICNQGRFASDYGLHSSRQDEALVRRGDRLAPTSMDDAVSEAAKQLASVGSEHGSSSLAVLVSPRATLEEGWLATRLAKDVLGTSSIDWRSSFASPEAADAVSLALDAADGDLEDQPDLIVVLNGNPVHQSPVLALRIQELARRYQVPLILLGHHHDTYLAAHANGQFHNQPGDTARVLSALSEQVSASDGAPEDLERLLHTTKGKAEALVDALKAAEKGLLVHTLEDFAGLYAPSEVPAAIHLCQSLGDNWGYLPVVKDRNAVGLHAVGAEPNGDGIAARQLVAEIANGSIKGLVVVGCESLGALGDVKETLEALTKLDTLVLLDSFRSEFAEKASVFLPIAVNLERDGVYADIEGNLALLRAAQDPMGGSLPAADVLSALGRALGHEDFGADNPEAAWDLVRNALAPDSDCELVDLELEGSFSDVVNYRRLPPGGSRTRGVPDNPGNYRQDGLHLRGSWKNLTVQEEKAHTPSEPEEGDGLLLTWGAHISGRGFINDRASIAGTLLPKPFVEVNPSDAERLGAKDDQFAVLHAKGQRAKVGLRVVDGPAPGSVYLPAGVAGMIDPSQWPQPVRVTLELLDEMVPNQGDALVEADQAPGESN